MLSCLLSNDAQPRGPGVNCFLGTLNFLSIVCQALKAFLPTTSLAVLKMFPWDDPAFHQLRSFQPRFHRLNHNLLLFGLLDWIPFAALWWMGRKGSGGHRDSFPVWSRKRLTDRLLIVSALLVSLFPAPLAISYVILLKDFHHRVREIPDTDKKSFFHFFWWLEGFFGIAAGQVTWDSRLSVDRDVVR